jgi:hypothetical protein
MVSNRTIKTARFHTTGFETAALNHRGKGRYAPAFR